MRYHEFLKEFGKLAHKFEIRPDHFIRTTVGYLECPITRVCRELTGKTFSTDEAPNAAQEMNLDELVAQEIIDSADNRRTREAGYSPHFSAHTRRDLTQLMEKAHALPRS